MNVSRATLGPFAVLFLRSQLKEGINRDVNHVWQLGTASLH